MVHPRNQPVQVEIFSTRRLVQNAPGHKLGDLTRRLGLRMPSGMQAHRAMADVLMTCQLWDHLCSTLRERLGGREPDLSLMQAVMRMPKAKAKVEAYLETVRV